jgi:cellulose synthase (UDP-forming)
MVALVINASPEWHIVTQTALLPMVAFWSAYNMVVLFLVCMMCLQTWVKRAEERFKLDEPVHIIGASGALSTGRIRDISLSGAAVEADLDRALVTKPGEQVRVFVIEVGFVNATVVRQAGHFVAVHFDQQPSVERELLVSKLFTLGLDTTTVSATLRSATVAMLTSIVVARMDATTRQPDSDGQADVAPAEKLPAVSMVIRPTAQARRLTDIGYERRSFAA